MDFDIGKLGQNWWEGHVWLSDRNSWHDLPMIESSEESEIERKRVKESLAVTVSFETISDKLLVEYPMLKTLRILSWIKRFLTNCKKQQVRGPLTLSETENQRKFLINSFMTEAVIT